MCSFYSVLFFLIVPYPTPVEHLFSRFEEEKQMRSVAFSGLRRYNLNQKTRCPVWQLFQDAEVSGI